jgi:dipeptidyl aminopeptidase/acylaminoacyl peptidase
MEYDWMTTELFHWKMPNGKIGEGILYKPENLDTTKKYPVIFHYYEKLSDGLNIYRTPSLSNGALSIPWYVSNGYLVFVPNMYYETGYVVKSIVETITSAVHDLSVIPWINAKKMGLQGHSFGGFETIALIANTNLFAAAQESAGYANAISYYNYKLGYLGGDKNGGVNRNDYFDIEQGNLGCSPWEQFSIYTENSPIFNVQNINTPLLMMHNKEDDNVPFSQAIELYTSLRRLRKKTWLLQYDKKDEPNEGHMISNSRVKQLDFTVRQQQFFNFYLRDIQSSKWIKKNEDEKNEFVNQGNP